MSLLLAITSLYFQAVTEGTRASEILKQAPFLIPFTSRVKIFHVSDDQILLLLSKYFNGISFFLGYLIEHVEILFTVFSELDCN